MTIREMWEDFERRAVMVRGESPREVALQKIGYVSGMTAALGTIYAGDFIDFDKDEVAVLLGEAFTNMQLDIDRKLPAHSEN